ncbi:ACAD11 [Symbiodinium pilosum]|uniref:ACAD11 protein n=1 Tax=Symbiodinium pilosum TaxID=2952 RepID=A0A812K859_SYMPI|nr:ACAD11 [Symbiodinium pilosum]
MEEWGDASTLLILIWSALGPILAPMMLVISYNNPRLFYSSADSKGQESSFFMHCEGHSFQIKSACDWTTPAVQIFPVLGLAIPVLLALWKLLHMRAYYVLMRNHIMLSFREGKRLGFKCGVALSVIFLHALAHFTLMVAFGHPCNDASCQGKHILNTSWEELLHDPSALSKDRSFILEATKLAVQYIVPGTLSVVLVFSMDDFVAELVPMGLFFASKPCTRYRELEKYLHVKEDIMRSAVKQIMEQQLEPCRLEEVCQQLRGMLQERRCRQLGDVDEEEEPLIEEDSSFLLGLREVVFLEWWPIQMLIDFPLVDEYSHFFNVFMIAHLFATNAILGFSTFVILRRVRIMVQEDMAAEDGRFAVTFSKVYPLVWYLLLGSILAMVLFRTMKLMVQVCKRVAGSTKPRPSQPAMSPESTDVP